MANKVVISTNIVQALTEAVEEAKHDKLFLLTDETTHELCLPIVKDIPCLSRAIHIIIGATDTHKNLETLAKVWTELGNGGGTRQTSEGLQPAPSNVASNTSMYPQPY